LGATQALEMARIGRMLNSIASMRIAHPQSFRSSIGLAWKVKGRNFLEDFPNHVQAASNGRLLAGKRPMSAWNQHDLRSTNEFDVD
jgi:hypothetical protein